MEQKDYVIVNIPSSYNTSYSTNSIYRLPDSPISPSIPPSIPPILPIPINPNNAVSYNSYSSQIYNPPYNTYTCRRRNRPKPLFNQTTIIQPVKNNENTVNNVNDSYITIGNYENHENHENNYLQDESSYNSANKTTLARRFKNYLGFKINNYNTEEYLNV